MSRTPRQNQLRSRIVRETVAGILVLLIFFLIYDINIIGVTVMNAIVGMALGVVLGAGLSYTAYGTDFGQKISNRIERHWWNILLTGTVIGVLLIIGITQIISEALYLTMLVFWITHLSVLYLLSIRKE